MGMTQTYPGYSHLWFELCSLGGGFRIVLYILCLQPLGTSVTVYLLKEI